MYLVRGNRAVKTASLCGFARPLWQGPVQSLDPKYDSRQFDLIQEAFREKAEDLIGKNSDAHKV